MPAQMNAIEVHALRSAPPAVDAIGFAVPVGATVGLLGGNGAGKTTTIAMLLGLLIPSAGHSRGSRPGHGPRPLRCVGEDDPPLPYVSRPQRLTVAENLRV